MAYVRSLPFPLLRLRNATDSNEYDNAWAEFVATYSDTILHTCRAVARDRDAAMDAYAHALDALRADDCRRLRAYIPEPEIKFSSWLVVVTRRLVHDYFRHRYGRSRSEDLDRRQEQTTRRRLEDLVADAIEPDTLIGAPYNEADARIRLQELKVALAAALEDLDASDRLLLALRFEDQRPIREIARTLGLASVFHVYRRLNGVLQRLRQTLERHGVEGSDP
jgi:RNA polymerase sigma factor (sigma-70 family)